MWPHTICNPHLVEIEELLAFRLAGLKCRRALAEALLRDHVGYPDKVIARRPNDDEWRLAEKQSRILKQFDIGVVPVWRLPARLQRVNPLPLLLFVRGNIDLLEKPAIGIVGSRLADESAITWAKDVAQRCAESKFVVVSGGAEGVDAAAHNGALAGRGETIAFLGVAADRIYPDSHRRFFEKIVVKGGALVSEYPPLEHTYATGHAARNRFIAAMSQVLIIAEADARSGTMSTATAARRLGVPIVVSPPSVGLRRAGLDRLAKTAKASTLATLEELRIWLK